MGALEIVAKQKQSQNLEEVTANDLHQFYPTANHGVGKGVRNCSRKPVTLWQGNLEGGTLSNQSHWRMMGEP